MLRFCYKYVLRFRFFVVVVFVVDLIWSFFVCERVQLNKTMETTTKRITRNRREREKHSKKRQLHWRCEKKIASLRIWLHDALCQKCYSSYHLFVKLIHLHQWNKNPANLLTWMPLHAFATAHFDCSFADALSTSIQINVFSTRRNKCNLGVEAHTKSIFSV